MIGADKPLKEAGIRTLDGLTEVATQMRAVVTRPMVKGDVSTALTARLGPPYLRYCGSCGATHSWRCPSVSARCTPDWNWNRALASVLRRIPGWPKRAPGPADDPGSAPERLQPIRNYLRFLGPATSNDVAAFLDAPVAEIKAHWPEDAVEVTVDGRKGWMLKDRGQSDHDAVLSGCSAASISSCRARTDT